MDSEKFIQLTKNELIVSCQALKTEPLYGSKIMARMSLAAQMGGAVAIRANGRSDIQAIKESINLPVIGLIKRNYENSSVFITPTKKELSELINVGVDVIALDGTKQKRPNNETLDEQIKYIRENSKCLIMADVSTVSEGMKVSSLGVDLVATTLSGYTPYTKNRYKPDLELIKELVEKVETPVIAEGNIQTPKEARKALEYGAHSVVVGSAITRPQIITKKFVEALK